MNKSKIQDGLHFLVSLTPSRIINASLVWSSFYVSRWLKTPKIWGKPIAISIEPTTSCNLRCPECPSGLRSFNRPTGMLSLELFKKIVDEVKNHTAYLILYFQGEPYLNKSFFDFCKYATSKKMYVAASTNAHYLSKEKAEETIHSGLSRLIISIDGTTQDVYQQYRIGGHLEKVIEGTKNIIQAKKDLNSKTPYIIFQFLVVKPNEHQIEDVKRLGKELGVDEVKFKTAQVYDYENGNSLIPDDQYYSRYKKGSDGKYRIKNKLLNQCWRLWHACVFTWDGGVVPCAFDKDATYNFGSIQKLSFTEIWKSTPYNNFRKQLLRGRDKIDICQNCTEGTKVWAE